MTLCAFCRKPIDNWGLGIFHKVQGWAEMRSGGGTNQISDRVELHEYAHGRCMKLRRIGIDAQQIGMFKGEEA